MGSEESEPPRDERESRRVEPERGAERPPAILEKISASPREDGVRLRELASELRSAAPADARPGVGSETILIAEDEASIRELACAALETQGYTVLAAADGEEALAVLERRGAEIDLVITDLVMPRLGGSELRREARRLAPDLRFLLTTGYGEPEAPPGGSASSAETPVLQKPWTAEELCARVREVLEA